MTGNKDVVRVLSESSKCDDKGVVCTLSKQKTSFDKKIPVRVKIEWQIEQFESLMDPKESVKHFSSRGVSSVLAPSAVWMLQVWPQLDPSSIAVDLYLTGEMADATKTQSGSYHIYLGGGADDSIERGTYEFGNGGYCKRFVISHDRVKKALQEDGSLVVAAEVDFLAPYDSDVQATIDKSDLINTLRLHGERLKSGDFSDCTLMVGGEQLKAHRLVLSAISPVFAKMFGNDGFQEARDGIVRIEDSQGMLKDTSAKPYRALLYYAYDGYFDWDLFGECKREVLILACKYLVNDLKELMEEYLVDEIAAESFAELALLADAYSCDELKKECVKYFSRNYETLVLSPQWEAMNKERVDLANELLRLVREANVVANGQGQTWSL